MTAATCASTAAIGSTTTSLTRTTFALAVLKVSQSCVATMADRRGERRTLPNHSVEVAVTADGAVVNVRAANGVFPPRVEYCSRTRFTPLVPCDVIKGFADTLDAQDRARLLTLLDSLTPGRR